jgi:hypothetical protein
MKKTDKRTDKMIVDKALLASRVAQTDKNVELAKAKAQQAKLAFKKARKAFKQAKKVAKQARKMAKAAAKEAKPRGQKKPHKLEKGKTKGRVVKAVNVKRRQPGKKRTRSGLSAAVPASTPQATPATPA